MYCFKQSCTTLNTTIITAASLRFSRVYFLTCSIKNTKHISLPLLSPYSAPGGRMRQDFQRLPENVHCYYQSLGVQCLSICRLLIFQTTVDFQSIMKMCFHGKKKHEILPFLILVNIQRQMKTTIECFIFVSRQDFERLQNNFQSTKA